MERMQAYARRPEGRGLLGLIALIVIIDLMARLWPSLPSSAGKAGPHPQARIFSDLRQARVSPSGLRRARLSKTPQRRLRKQQSKRRKR